MTCSECHKAQTRINKILKKVVDNATKACEEAKKTVIVFPTQDQREYDYCFKSEYKGAIFVYQIDPKSP